MNKKYKRNYFNNGGNIFSSIKNITPNHISGGTAGLGMLTEGINNMFSKPQIPEVNAEPFQMQANNRDSYMQEFGNYKAMDNVSWKDLDTDGKASNIGGNALGSTMKGASAGATFGPWGAAIGGVFGGLTSIFGGASKKRKLKRAARRMNTQIDDMNNTNMANLVDQGNIINRVSNWDLQANFAAMGGQFNGGNYNTGITSFDNGGTHEMNPYGGIPVSYDEEGNPNLVEENEVMWNDYVFSDRLKIDNKQLLLDIGLPLKLKNKSFAEAANILSEERSERPNDVISKASMDITLNKLKEYQETIKSYMEDDNQNNEMNMFAEGGQMNLNLPFNVKDFMSFKEDGIPQQAQQNNQSIDLGKYQAFIDKYSNGKSPLKAEDFYRVAQEYGIPMDVMLAQAALESNFGTKGMASKTNNIFNVGNNSDKEHYKETSYDNWMSGLERYARLIRNEYADERGIVDTQALINNNFTQTKPNGGHYAGGEPKYTPLILNLVNELEDNKYSLPDNIKPLDGNIENKESLYANPNEKEKEKSTIKQRDLKDFSINDILPKEVKSNININDISKNIPTTIEQHNNSKQVEQPNSDRTFNFGDTNNLMRLAPVAANLGLLTNDIFSKPERMDFADKYRINSKIEPNFIGNKLTYNPLDSDYLLNKVRQQGEASTRNVINTSGGNRGAAMAGILASNYNTQNALGDAYFNMNKINDDKRRQVEEFNRGTNMFNSQMDMQAQQGNIQTNQFNAQLGKEQDIMNMQNRAARRNNIRGGIANIGNIIGSIGTENTWKDMAIKQTGYDMFNNNPYVKNKKAFGGIIYKKRIK